MSTPLSLVKQFELIIPEAILTSKRRNILREFYRRLSGLYIYYQIFKNQLIDNGPIVSKIDLNFHLKSKSFPDNLTTKNIYKKKENQK